MEMYWFELGDCLLSLVNHISVTALSVLSAVPHCANILSLEPRDSAKTQSSFSESLVVFITNQNVSATLKGVSASDCPMHEIRHLLMSEGSRGKGLDCSLDAFENAVR